VHKLSPVVAKLASELQQAGVAPGIAIGLRRGGQNLIESAGSASSEREISLTERSKFQLGCITKVLTCVVGLEMAHGGALDLDAPIARYLHELREIPLGSSVRARNLLSHTSGYQGLNVADPTVRYCSTWAKFMEALKQAPLLFVPGTVFNYEHTECVLLAELLQRVAGQTLAELYQAHIFRPLDIRCGRIGEETGKEDAIPEHSFDAKSGRYAPLREVPHCAFWDGSLSDLTMSVSDLLTLGEALGGWNARSTFHPETIAQLRRTHVLLPACIGGSQPERVPHAFGLGLAEYGVGLFGHNGSARGQTCALRIDLKSRAVLVVALNAWRPVARDMLVEKILACFHEPGAEAPPPPPVPYWDPQRLPGTYIGARGSTMSVEEHGSEIHCEVRWGAFTPPLRLVIVKGPNGQPQLASPISHLTIGFFRDPASETPAALLGLNAFRRARPTEH
jgi:CubicO group peptidase (beta-lactamase class C family)